jgi:hypothetical protein
VLESQKVYALRLVEVLAQASETTAAGVKKNAQ